jgi:hypothetical protein
MAPAPSTKTGRAMSRVLAGVLASAQATPVTVATETVSQTGNSLIASGARRGTSTYSADPLIGNAFARLMLSLKCAHADASLTEPLVALELTVPTSPAPRTEAFSGHRVATDSFRIDARYSPTIRDRAANSTPDNTTAQHTFRVTERVEISLESETVCASSGGSPDPRGTRYWGVLSEESPESGEVTLHRPYPARVT